MHKADNSAVNIDKHVMGWKTGFGTHSSGFVRISPGSKTHNGRDESGNSKVRAVLSSLRGYNNTKTSSVWRKKKKKKEKKT